MNVDEPIGICHQCGEIHTSPHSICDDCWLNGHEHVRRHIQTVSDLLAGQNR